MLVEQLQTVTSYNRLRFFGHNAVNLMNSGKGSERCVVVNLWLPGDSSPFVSYPG